MLTCLRGDRDCSLLLHVRHVSMAPLLGGTTFGTICRCVYCCLRAGTNVVLHKHITCTVDLHAFITPSPISSVRTSRVY